MGMDKQTDGREHLWGSIKYLILPKVTNDSTHLHNNKIMYYTHPKVIPYGRTNKRTNIYLIFRDKLSLPEGSLDRISSVNGCTL
jgi:hypothetical protein